MQYFLENLKCKLYNNDSVGKFMPYFEQHFFNKLVIIFTLYMVITTTK